MRFHNRFVLVALLCATLFAQAPPQMPAERSEREIEQQFLSVPDPRQAEQHMKILTAEPHIAGSPEDRKTADYVAPGLPPPASRPVHR